MQRLENLRILVSLSSREGIVPFIGGLGEIFPTEVVATGGTAQYLIRAGIETTTVEQLTGSPYSLDGRVKMLHEMTFLALLANQENPEHMRQLKERGIEPFNMVVVNLYPFEEKVRAGVSLEEAIEAIDIGGPAAVRAAAKNHLSVIPICNPDDYPLVMQMLRG